MWDEYLSSYNVQAIEEVLVARAQQKQQTWLLLSDAVQLIAKTHGIRNAQARVIVSDVEEAGLVHAKEGNLIINSISSTDSFSNVSTVNGPARSRPKSVLLANSGGIVFNPLAGSTRRPTATQSPTTSPAPPKPPPAVKGAAWLRQRVNGMLHRGTTALSATGRRAPRRRSTARSANSPLPTRRQTPDVATTAATTTTSSAAVDTAPMESLGDTPFAVAEAQTSDDDDSGWDSANSDAMLRGSDAGGSSAAATAAVATATSAAAASVRHRSPGEGQSRAHSHDDGASATAPPTATAAGAGPSRARAQTEAVRSRGFTEAEEEMRAALEEERALAAPFVPALGAEERVAGMLVKRGNSRFAVTWRPRLAVLSGSLLAYFEDEAEETVCGVVDLCAPGLALEWGPQVSAGYGRPYCFHLRTPKRVYAFQTPRLDELSRWVSYLRAHLRATRSSAVSMQMRTCRQLTGRLRSAGLLRMAASESAMTLSVRGRQRAFRFGSARRTRRPADAYTLGAELGRGAYGTVRLARERRGGGLFALKEMARPREKRVLRVLQDEVRVMEQVRAAGGHPHVIGLHEVMEDEGHVWLVLELAEGGHLMDAISSAERFSEADARRYFRQIASAIAFLHANNILHRDLKPENLQLAADGSIKLLDFGFATRVPDPKPRDNADRTLPETRSKASGGGSTGDSIADSAGGSSCGGSTIDGASTIDGGSTVGTNSSTFSASPQTPRPTGPETVDAATGEASVRRATHVGGRFGAYAAARPAPHPVQRNASWAGPRQARAQEDSRNAQLRRAAIRARALAALPEVRKGAEFGTGAATDKRTATDESAATGNVAVAKPETGGAATETAVFPPRVHSLSPKRYPALVRRVQRARARARAAAETASASAAAARSHRGRVLRRSQSELGPVLQAMEQDGEAAEGGGARGTASDGEAAEGGDDDDAGLAGRPVMSLPAWTEASGQPAWMAEEKLTTYVGTRYACAPEIQDHRPYCRAVDVWGLGVVLYMLLFGHGPISEQGGIGMFRIRLRKAEVQRNDPEWSALSPEARHLIDATLQLDPMARPTVEHILRHPWMRLGEGGQQAVPLNSVQRSLGKRRKSLLERDPKVLNQLVRLDDGPTEPAPEPMAADAQPRAV